METLPKPDAKANLPGTPMESKPLSDQDRDAALKHLIDAIQVAMKDIELASDPDDKAQLRVKCKDLLKQAEKLKQMPTGSMDGASPPSSTLTAPSSTRTQWTAEQMLVLKAGALNGTKFHLWIKPPSAKEFTLEEGKMPFTDHPDLKLSEHQMQFFVDFRRAKDALPPPYLFKEHPYLFPMMKSSRPVDLVQDAASDCSVVASLCALTARAERGHGKLLKSVFYPWDDANDCPAISESGKYVIRLNFNGGFRRCEVDDRLPVSDSTRTLHVVDRKNPCLLWPAIMEKAYLKVRGGYNFPGSNSGTDLWIMTGWIPEQVWLQDDDTIPANLWKRMFNAFQYGDILVTMGTGKMDHRVERELGLAGQHDYAVLDMKEDGNERFFLLKNPWVDGVSWKGSRIKEPQTEGSDATTEPATNNNSLCANHKDTPGVFWMTLNQVMQHFESIYLNWNPGLFQYRQDIHFPWDLTDRPSRPAASFVFNPQFSIICEGGTMWLLLCRFFQNKTMPASEEPATTTEHELSGHINIYVYEKDGTTVYLSTELQPFAHGRYVDSPQCLLKLDLPKTKTTTPYTVVVSEQNLAAQRHNFTLSAFSHKPITLGRAINKHTRTSTVSSAWTESCAGGHANLRSFTTNPQYRLSFLGNSTIPARVIVYLETSKPNSYINVKLLHSEGKRLLAVGRRDIVADSGDYNQGCCMLTVDALECKDYTIIVSTFEEGFFAPFTLRVDSTHKSTLQLLPPENAGRLPVRIHPASFGSFGEPLNKIAFPMIPHRYVRLNIVAKLRRPHTGTTPPRRSRRPEEPDLLDPIPDTDPSRSVPALEPTQRFQPRVLPAPLIRLSVVLGRRSDSTVVAVANEGEFGDSERGVRTPDFDLWPEMYRGDGEIWVVLERLGGNGDGERAGVEDRVEVTMFVEEITDKKVMQVGKWRPWD